jgi:hypothetical protein
MNLLVFLAACGSSAGETGVGENEPRVGPSPCPPDPDPNALHISVSDAGFNFHIFAEVQFSFEGGAPATAVCSIAVREGTCLRWDIPGEPGHYDVSVSAPGLASASWSVDVPADDHGAAIPQSMGFWLEPEQ